VAVAGCGAPVTAALVLIGSLVRRGSVGLKTLFRTIADTLWSGPGSASPSSPCLELVRPVGRGAGPVSTTPNAGGLGLRLEVSLEAGALADRLPLERGQPLYGSHLPSVTRQLEQRMVDLGRGEAFFGEDPRGGGARAAGEHDLSS
jgi:hypothetical protein